MPTDVIPILQDQPNTGSASIPSDIPFPQVLTLPHLAAVRIQESGADER